MGQGLVSSLSHPGGNITGFADFEVSLGTKWLEILYPQQRRARINRLQIQPVIGRGLGVENGSDSPNTGHNLLEKVDPNPGA